MNELEKYTGCRARHINFEKKKKCHWNWAISCTNQSQVAKVNYERSSHAFPSVCVNISAQLFPFFFCPVAKIPLFHFSITASELNIYFFHRLAKKYLLSLRDNTTSCKRQRSIIICGAFSVTNNWHKQKCLKSLLNVPAHPWKQDNRLDFSCKTFLKRIYLFILQYLLIISTCTTFLF